MKGPPRTRSAQQKKATPIATSSKQTVGVAFCSVLRHRVCTSLPSSIPSLCSNRFSFDPVSSPCFFYDQVNDGKKEPSIKGPPTSNNKERLRHEGRENDRLRLSMYGPSKYQDQRYAHENRRRTWGPPRNKKGSSPQRIVAEYVAYHATLKPADAFTQVVHQLHLDEQHWATAFEKLEISDYDRRSPSAINKITSALKGHLPEMQHFTSYHSDDFVLTQSHLYAVAFATSTSQLNTWLGCAGHDAYAHGILNLLVRRFRYSVISNAFADKGYVVVESLFSVHTTNITAAHKRGKVAKSQVTTDQAAPLGIITLQLLEETVRSLGTTLFTIKDFDDADAIQARRKARLAPVRFAKTRDKVAAGYTSFEMFLCRPNTEGKPIGPYVHRKHHLLKVTDLEPLLEALFRAAHYVTPWLPIQRTRGLQGHGLMPSADFYTPQLNEMMSQLSDDGTHARKHKHKQTHTQTLRRTLAFHHLFFFSPYFPPAHHTHTHTPIRSS
jgi:hypothetical protein